MRRVSQWNSMLLAALVVGCASYGDPGPIGKFGYVEKGLSGRAFTVVHRGGTKMPVEMRHDYLLYRAAAFTLGKGYDSFTILEEKINGTDYVSISPTRLAGSTYRQVIRGGTTAGEDHFQEEPAPYGGSSVGGFTTSNFYITSSGTFRMHEGTPPPGSINARDLIATLNAKYPRAD